MKKYLLIVLALLSSKAIAEGTRELDSHEHGVGKLNIAVEGNTVAMELLAPGADIVGFEYAAESAEDRASIDSAVVTLSQPLKLFVISTAAGCTIVQASAKLKSEDDHDKHGEHEDEHDHEDGHDDGHTEEHHSDDQHADAAGHTEFYAEYTLTCGNPEALSEISLTYFEAFENAQELDVQIVSASGAQTFEILRNAPILDLRGMF